MDMTPGASLGPYRILRPLGSGGMGAVYLAWDQRLERRVALKLLTHTAGDDAVRHVRHEARAVARLTHANIAALYDTAEHNGVSFLVMEYVDGEPLSHLARSQPVSVAQALDIGIQLTDALSYAHGEGIIHRDVKPANVMLTRDGKVKVLDLGLARVTSSDPAAPTQSLSDAVVAPRAGTPAYMAPERLGGQPADARTDVYSVGVLLFELLTGTRPFLSSDFVSLAVSIATQPTPHVSGIRPDLPAALDDLIARAMAKEAATRVATAAELRDGLVSVRDELTNPRPAPIPDTAHDWWRLTLTAAAIGALALISWFVFRPVPGAVTPATIALAPIVSAMSDDPELDELGVLLGSVLSRNLAALPGVTIVVPDLAQDGSPGSKTAPTAGPSPPRAYSVTLTIRRKGSAVVAAGALIRQGESRPIWDQEFEGEALGVLRFATTNLATAFERDLALGRVLTGEQRTRLQRLPTGDAQALVSYLRGRVVLDTATNRAADDEAAAAYARAIQRDAAFAEAHAGLAQVFLLTQRHAPGESGWRDKAKEAAAKAVALDTLSDLAHVACALVARELTQKDDALVHARRAVILNPSGDDGHRVLGLALIDAGQADLGFAALRQAVSLRPGHWANAYALGIAQLRGGRTREAVDPLRRTLELRKDFQAGYVNLGVAYLRLDEWALSVGNSQRALDLEPRDAYALNNLGTAYYWDGRFTLALQSFQAAVREEPNAIRHMNLGDAYHRLGRMADAKQAYLDAVDLAEKQLAKTYSAGTAAVAAKCEAKLGRTDIAETHALAALAADKDNDEVVYKLAVVYAIAGRLGMSLDHLERAVGLGYSRALVRRDPDLQALRNDPRFKALVQQKNQ